MVEAKVNARWSLDFVHDQFASGRRFRILSIVDDVTRECLAAIPDTSISGRRVARELTTLIETRGKPGMIVSDHGAEFTSNAILGWATDHQVEWHYIAPGKPMQNGYIESFNGRMRDELLNESLFLDLNHTPPARRRLGRRLQHGKAAFFARLQNTGGVCRPSHRNRPSRCATCKLRALAGCSHRAERRINRQGSNRRWMKVWWQVKVRIFRGQPHVPKIGIGRSPADQSFSRCTENSKNDGQFTRSR